MLPLKKIHSEEVILLSDNLQHHGVKGQKWGVRRYQNKDGTLTKAGMARYKDEVNSKERYIKEGTEIQNISKNQLKLGNGNHKGNRLYVSYTDYDKDEYTSLMGNFMYGGDSAYKNTFVVKKDMKVASDQDVVKAFIEIAKRDPIGTAKDIANAHNENAMFFKKSEKTLAKKISQLNDDPNDQKNIKMAQYYVAKAIMGSKATTTNNFYSYLTKKGFDAISDTNDRKGGAQDPLIILNMDVIKQTGSVHLTSKDLEAYYQYTMDDKHTKRANDHTKIQR